MDVMPRQQFYIKKIRFHFIWGLVFSFLLTGCGESNKNVDRNVIIEYNNNKAETILIPQELLPGITETSLASQLQVQLKNKNVPIIGDYKMIADVVTFTPLLPFTRGLQYEVVYKNKIVSQFEISMDTFSKAPAVVAIYPTNDTVPENLLKIYIRFSKPMQEGEAIKNITVLKNNRDTIPSIFLDLENELWNKERTLLTLWLDPGRIKRDLQPNITAGTPLEKGNRYSVLINKDWRGADGIKLINSFRHDLFAGERDATSPNILKWTIEAPEANTVQPLRIHLHETLDHVLLENTGLLKDSQGNIIKGIFETGSAESILLFTPAQSWATGNYVIEIESRLENLAGNNLNRLFDNDISQPSKNTQQKIYTRTFAIK